MNVLPGRVLLGLYGFTLATSISGALATGYLLAAYWLFRSAQGSFSFPREWSPLDVPILAFFAWGLVSTMSNHSTTLVKAMSIQSGFLLFFLSVRGLSTEENGAWLKWLCWGAAFSGVYAIVQASLGIDRIPTLDRYIVPEALTWLPKKAIALLSLRDGRAVATRSHPLTFAEGMLIAFFIAVALPLTERRLLRRLTSAQVAVILAGIVLSFGRGVWLGLIAGCAILAWMWRDRKIVRVWVAAGVVLIVAAVAFVPRVRARVFSIVAPSSGEATDQGSRSTRFMLWTAASGEIREKPIMGHGLKGLKLIITEPGATEPRPWSEAHNIYLQILGERGLIGLGLFLWIIVVAFRTANAAPPGYREAGLALLIGLLIAGLTESWVKDKEVDMIFWAVLGAIEQARLGHKKEAA